MRLFCQDMRLEFNANTLEELLIKIKVDTQIRGNIRLIRNCEDMQPGDIIEPNDIVDCLVLDESERKTDYWTNVYTV